MRKDFRKNKRSNIMNEKQKNYTQERVTAREVKEELALALRNYFIGQVQINEEGIILSFAGGGKFRITVQEL
jgi:hypothetical protein